jgi:hypothetical protein
MRRKLEYTFQKGDLVKLVSWDTPNEAGRDDVVLGAIDTSSDDPDPILKSGTLCTVLRIFEDEMVTSRPAYVVMVEHEGKLHEMWAYDRDIELVSR